METTNKTNKPAMYIVRSYKAGVFYGEIESREGKEVAMRNVRCLWYWDGAASLLQLAAEGVKRPNECKFTMAVDSLLLTDVCEIIPCTDAAIENINAVAVWKR